MPTAYISAARLRHNIAVLRQHMCPGTRLCAVLKANAYGLGAPLVASAIQDLCEHFATVTIDEAEEIRPQTNGKPILVLRPVYAGLDHDQLKLAIERRLTITLSSLEAARYVDGLLSRWHQTLACHVKIDSGMGRGGVPIDHAQPLLDFVRNSRFLQLTGVYTHFAVADEPELIYTRQQTDRFHNILQSNSLHPQRDIICHSANSAATLRFPQSHFDMVRPGIALYGYTCSSLHSHFPLQPAVKIEAPLIQVKHIAAGQSCGYGRTFTAVKPMTVGLVPVGYADGLNRLLSNKAVMKIGDIVVPVVGRISMDQTIIDLTPIPEPHEGMKVTVLDDCVDSPCNVQARAIEAQTICQEILTSIGRRIKRVLIPAAAAEIREYPAIQTPTTQPLRR